MSEQSPTNTVGSARGAQLSEVTTQATTLGELGRTLRAPWQDLARSPAALRVARLAERRGLFLFDYEQRVELELPEAWHPVGRPDLGVTGVPAGWERGVRGESKYLSFRHEVLLGSLHAGHRAKWSTHELCHGLVGFCWKPDGSTLYHALAARLAEVLPVALWYFFDEAHATRCARHATQTEVGPGFCLRCEQRQARAELTPETPLDVLDGQPGPHRTSSVWGDDPAQAAWTQRGLDFVRRELDAVRRSVESGQPVFTPHGAIDLMTDGIQYAAAHGPRLRAPETASAMAHAFSPGTPGVFSDLLTFADHVERLAGFVAGVDPTWPVLAGNQAELAASDLVLRLMQVAADTDGECFAALTGLAAELGAQQNGAGVSQAIAAYEALFEDFELPEASDVFAVGYALPSGHGFGVEQVAEGLGSALGATMETLREGGETETFALVRAFCASNAPSRAPLAERFVQFLSAGEASSQRRELVGLASLEAAIASVAPPDPVELGLGLDGALAETLALASGVALVRPGFDAGGLLMHGAADPKGPRSFLVRRDAADEVGLVALSEALAERLAAGPLGAAQVVAEAERDAELRALLDEGLLVADRWELEAPREW